MSNNSSKLKVLHTSDWHLGRSLYDRKRYDEFGLFLDWLAEFIQMEKIDALLVAGDIFDTSTPSNRAQELYYQFLTKVAHSDCRHIVITGGNHDSPSFLNAPRELLRFFNVYVIGAMTDNPEEEVILLRDNFKNPEAIICAVPYLRDKDIRTVVPGEKMEDKNRKLVEGLIAHYAEVGNIALKRQTDFPNIPIIGMGHLFTSGSKTTDGDGVRELYVGGVAYVNENSFPECFDYLALGHLHIAQKVGNSENKRYCGSPVPIGFGESGQEKKVIVIEFDNNLPIITEHVIPIFQKFERITGNAETIMTKIGNLKTEGSNAWLEIDHTASEAVTGFRDLVYETIAGTQIEVLRIKYKLLTGQVLTSIDGQETLDDLDSKEVFNRCLDSNQLKEPDRSALILAYEEIIVGMNGGDINAE
ncbi:MAG: exonuclease SbcCD subunit D C-terminal domain-containing protein [Mariniphaga sp.]